MFQLHVDITIILGTLSHVTNLRIFREGIVETIAYLVTNVIDRKVIVLSTIANTALMVVAQSIGIAALQLEPKILFLTIDVARNASMRGYDLIYCLGHSDGLDEAGHRQVIEYLITCDIHFVVSDTNLEL